MQELEGSIISHYRLQKQIDLAGLSESYLAIDRRTGQIIVMRLIQHSDNDYIERLYGEIQALSALKHEHILPILDYGKHDPWYYIVTPHIVCGTLEQQFDKGPLSMEDAGKILEQLAYTLQFARSHGIIYCNVKPSNILLKEAYHIYLTVDSLSQDMRDDQNPAETGTITETAEYVAPLPAYRRATLADDAYTLGILLCQMLTAGCTPSQALGPGGLLSQQTLDSQLPPAEFVLSLPRAIEDVVLHALAKDPQKRFQTPLEFAQEYQNALAQFSSPTEHLSVSDMAQGQQVALINISNMVQGQPATLVQRLSQKLKDKRLLAGAIALAVIIPLVSLLIVGLSFFSMHNQTAQLDHQSSVASTSTKISPSPTPSPQNTHLPKEAWTSSGQAYGASPTATAQPTEQPTTQSYSTEQPTVLPVVQPHPPAPAPPVMKLPGKPGKGKIPGTPKPGAS